MNERPSKRELLAMSEQELFEKLLLDPAFSSLYRQTIFELRAKQKPDIAQPQALNSAAIQQQKGVHAPNIQHQLSRIRSGTPEISAEAVTKISDAILESDWDYIDPDPKGMQQKTPEEVKKFLQSLSWRQYTYQELGQGTGGGQRLFNTIIDAYGRWWRLQIRDYPY